MAGDGVFRVFLQGYGLTLTPELSHALAGYRLIWNLGALVYEHRACGDWFDSYRQGIEAAIAILTPRAP